MSESVNFYRLDSTALVLTLLFLLIAILPSPITAAPLHTVSAIVTALKQTAQKYTNQWAICGGWSLEYQHSLVLGLWRKGLSIHLVPATGQNVTVTADGAPVTAHSVPHTRLRNTKCNPFMRHSVQPKLRLTTSAALWLILNTLEPCTAPNSTQI
jgi:hypothetical protein